MSTPPHRRSTKAGGARRPGVAPDRVPLSRERVLQAAVELADQGGLEAISMRRLAKALGVEAMSLYYHAANKDDILDGMLDLVEAEIELPEASVEWKPAARTIAVNEYAALRRHAWAADLLMSAARVNRGRLRQMDVLLAALRRGGFPDDLVDHAYHAIDIYVTGFGLWQSRFRAMAPGSLEELAATFLRETPLADYPNFADHVQWHLGPTVGTGTSTFEFGLDLILDGLERARDRVGDSAVA